jgi:hypothetical protein
MQYDAMHAYKRGSKGGWIHANRAAGSILLSSSATSNTIKIS